MKLLTWKKKGRNPNGTQECFWSQCRLYYHQPLASYVWFIGFLVWCITSIQNFRPVLLCMDNLFLNILYRLIANKSPKYTCFTFAHIFYWITQTNIINTYMHEYKEGAKKESTVYRLVESNKEIKKEN